MILFMGDLHYGVAKDDPWIQDIQRDSVKQVIEICKLNGITEIIQFGDWFDVRKAITHVTMEFSRENVNEFKKAGINLHVIIGNHDLHFKNKIHPNSVSELLSKHSNVTIYDKPTTVEIEGVLIDLIPWMCEENTKEILDHIKSSNAKICIGHWELNGFYFYKGMKSHGLEPDFLKKYDKVYSGHFHTISEAGNVLYIGTPYSITAGDEDDPRGVWLFNPKDHTTKFVQNKTMWHQRVQYPSDINLDDYKDIAVRVIVNKMDDNFTEFESKLESVVHSLKIVSKNNVQGPDVDDSEDIIVESLETIIREYINAIDGISDEEKEILFKYALSLHVESVNS
ncbi:recombination endonuclease subunit [Proteus phage SJ_PmiM]|nr:recombination endonuclease subunit [Proteus phage SJ_PmiM]